MAFAEHSEPVIERLRGGCDPFRSRAERAVLFSRRRGALFLLFTVQNIQVFSLRCELQESHSYTSIIVHQTSNLQSLHQQYSYIVTTRSTSALLPTVW